MTKSYNPATSLGRLRLAIGDTNFAEGKGCKPDGENYLDDELTVFLTLAANWMGAAAVALRALATLYAREARTVWVEGYKEDLTKTAAELRLSADDWALKASLDLGGMSDLFAYNEDAKHLFGSAQYGADLTDQGS